jgi:hypothetical protein
MDYTSIIILCIIMHFFFEEEDRTYFMSSVRILGNVLVKFSVIVFLTHVEPAIKINCVPSLPQAASAIILLTFKDGFIPKRSRPVGPGVPENHRERARKTSVI